MQSFLPFHLPDLGEEEVESVVEVLRSGWLTTGSKTKQFEHEFAERVGATHAVAVNSCTAALHLALEAVEISAGDEIIVPTMTFAATAEVVSYCRAKPVLVDCRNDTLNINVDLLEKAITSKTKAIIPVHYAGQPCEMDRIMELARHHNLKVIEDAAHALPTRYRGRMIGTIGDITCFSFYATKTITTGEGGMATTENAEWADRMRILSLHGISRDAVNRYSPEGKWYYEICCPGFKYNLTDLASAVGIPQLQKCDLFGEIRHRYAALYNEGFKDIAAIRTPPVEEDIEHAWHLYVIQLELDQLRISRNEMIDHLKKHGIGTSVHFIPLHLHPYYKNTFGFVPDDFPTASRVFDRIISLPIYPKMTEADVHRVIDVTVALIREYRR
ncbi:MAG: DegT/DnrJ/EryC1/StrS family aminotransferase [Nitrospirales bacterium]|nr:DegT/DnrJ/EryC1/StrS family aminotransferase [Nitrospirales bacterium]